IVDLDLNLLAQFLELFPKVSDVGGRNPFVLRAKDAENWRVNLFHRLGIGCQMAIVDDVGGKRGFLQRYIDGIASALAPAARAHTVLLDIWLRSQEFKSRVQVALGPVFRDAPHNFVRLLGSSRNFTAI